MRVDGQIYWDLILTLVSKQVCVLPVLFTQYQGKCLQKLILMNVGMMCDLMVNYLCYANNTELLDSTPSELLILVKVMKGDSKFMSL